MIKKPDELLNMMTSDKDLYYVSLMLLYLSRKDGRYSTISELAYLLEPKSFLNLLWYYEGQTIRIPTKGELDAMLRLILAYYYYDIQKLPWQEVVVKVGLEFTPHNSRHLKARLVWLRRTLEKVALPKGFIPSEGS
ncbi:hypothetical protein CEW46_21405 [Bacillus cereus]|nr:hypothetical protein CEW46_21405 [Bacillus cereus]